MLTGSLPFSGEYDGAIVYAILNEQPQPLQKHLSDAPSELIHIFNRLLEKDPEDRYQSMSDLVSELRRLKKHSSSVSSLLPAARPLLTRPHRNVREKEAIGDRYSLPQASPPWQA